MLGNLTGWHLIIILAIILLLFGAPKLPALAKSIAQSMRIFKNEIGDDKKTGDDDVTRHSATDSTLRRDADVPTVRPTSGDDHLKN
ncbi:twin-arginine translocase TatA/TatE family subunit [Frigoribacterium sp. CFBP 13729]|jgi:sec-independent protein translocase protein TatA|uniref:twin-arginine translocase TatA/TatE family subunit n=1 Tax=unclassified Frigoribacterium TaxID=2627005 RepID=UPI00177F5A33|nr:MULTISPECIES: twin-arginine translocase TatA/TatE family subunit [unclassified Frigoribacterium]MBD8584317.1 twin-arginine translocase TatA/TatE family subunit [Frigoribacterium sp. CFBP 8766]MBD8609076.1 twin-arginine translocase TatA/TatE family subunit [Frigoribacterium sp. CFBP 13729]